MSTQRELERQRKAAEKAAKERHLQARAQEVDQKNQDIAVRIHELETLLEKSLSNPEEPGNVLASIVGLHDVPPIVSLPPALPPQKSEFEAMIPEAGFMEKMTGLGKSKRLELAREAQQRYEAAVDAYRRSQAEYDAKVSTRQKEIEKRQNAYNSFHEFLAAKHPKAVKKYFETILKLSAYPAGFPRNSQFSYNPETGEMVLEYDLPKYEDIMPVIKGYKFIKTRDEIQELTLNKTDEKNMKSLYEDVIAAIALRTLHELFSLDYLETLSLVIFNGMVNTVDKATGQDIRLCLISVQVSREDFARLDLARVDKQSCLKHLKAQTSPSSSELVPIKPLVQLVTTDPRFVDEVDILSGMDSRTNLLEMSPGDFEHLIANLFTKMGFKTGTTNISRDGGVDVIAFDERPILGGKVIIQAKRYRNTVGVESVRALYGVMQDEGATKGVLVTTSSFGKASREFVKDKPIELLDGNGLLHYLSEHGYEMKIEIPKS